MAFISVLFVQSLSHVQLFVTPWTAALQAFLSFTISWSLLTLVSTESVMPPSPLFIFQLQKIRGLWGDKIPKPCCHFTKHLPETVLGLFHMLACWSLT